MIWRNVFRLQKAFCFLWWLGKQWIKKQNKKFTHSVLEIIISQINLVKNKVKQPNLWGYIATTCTTQVELTQVLPNWLYGFYIRYAWLQKYHLVKKLPIIGTILLQKYPWITFADLNFDGFNNKVVDLLWVELNRAKSL